MRCLVIGGNFTNRGAESMVLVTVDQLSQLWPGVEIVVASYAKTERHPYGPTVISGPRGAIGFDLIRNPRDPMRFLRVLLARYGPERVRQSILHSDPYLAAVESADVVVDISGFALSDQRSATRRIVFGVEFLTASAFGKPVLLLTQAFGPMRRFLTKAIARWVLPRAALVIARDDESVDHILSLGIEREVPLHRCADMALLLPVIEPPSRDSTPILGIVPNVNLLSPSERSGTPGAHVQQLAAMADLGREFGAEVVFVCFESFLDREIDDVWIAREAISRMTHTGARLVGDRGAMELKGIIAGLDFVVGARFHSVVAAVSAATPFLAIGWAHKYAALAVDAGVPYACVDGRTASTEDILDAIRNGWNRRTETNRILESRHEALFGSARRAFELVGQQWSVAHD